MKTTLYYFTGTGNSLNIARILNEELENSNLMSIAKILEIMAKENKPIKEFRAGNVQASIWKNEIEKGNRTGSRHSVRIQKRFRKQDGSYKNSDCFFPNELPRLILVAQRAYDYVTLAESK